MIGYDLLADREPQSDAATTHGSSGFGLIKTREHFFLFFVRDARAVIGNSHEHGTRRQATAAQRIPTICGKIAARRQIREAHADLATGWREFEGVLQQVVKHLSES